MRLAPDEYRIRTIARFECGHEDYRWLNDAIGVGEQTPAGPIYTLHEVV